MHTEMNSAKPNQQTPIAQTQVVGQSTPKSLPARIWASRHAALYYVAVLRRRLSASRRIRQTLDSIARAEANLREEHRALGQAAENEGLPATLGESRETLAALNEQRTQSESQRKDLERQLAQSDARYSSVAGTCHALIAEHTQREQQIRQELDAGYQELRRLAADLGFRRNRVRQLSNQRDRQRAHARRRRDNAEQQQLQRGAADCGLEIGDETAELERLNQVIAVTREPMIQARARLQKCRRALRAYRRQLRRAQAQLQRHKRRLSRAHSDQVQTAARLEQQIDEQHRCLGARLDDRRPDRQPLQGFYQRIDELGDVIRASQTQIDQLRVEAESYDPALYRRGRTALLLAGIVLLACSVGITLL